MTATPAPALTAAELATVQAFDAAPYPVEVAEAALVETVAEALWDADGGDVRWVAVAHDSYLRARYRRLAAAAIAAYRAQDGGAEEAVRRVEALLHVDGVPRHDSKTIKVGDIRAALATQAGEF